MYQLRTYQLDLKNKIYKALADGAKAPLAVSVTGSGKTVTFCAMAYELAIANVLGEPAPVAIIVHRRELVSQICVTLARASVPHNIIAPKNVVVGIIAAQRRAVGKQWYDHRAPITVVSVDTLNSRIDRYKNWADGIRVWIQDEAAHVLKGNKWGKAISVFPNARGIGFTATPQRLDKRGLGTHADGVFDTMIVGPSAKYLINEGYLSKYKIVVPPGDYEKHLVKANEGSDFTREAMAVASRESCIVGDVVKNYLKFCKNKQAIVFATDIESAFKLEKEFIENGVPAKTLTGETPDQERSQGIIDFEEERTKVLINVDLFDEGFDVPNIECVIMARPTMSVSKYLQCCLDTETEILTKRGWLKYNEIKNDDIASAFNIETKTMEWVEIENIIIRPRNLNEKVYSFNSPNLNFRITSEHDIVVKSRKSTNWIKEEIDKCVLRKELFHVPISAPENIKCANIKDDEVRLLGWFMSDGTRNNKKNNITIGQSLANENYVNEIRNLLQRLNLKYGECEVKRTGEFSKYKNLIQFTLSIFKPKRHFKSWQGKNDISKLEKWLDRTIPECYNLLSERQIGILLDTWNKGNGSKLKSINWIQHTMTISMGDSEEKANRLQSLLVRRGYRCNLAVAKVPIPLPNRRLIQQKRQGYLLHVKKVSTSSIAGLNNKDGKLSNKKPYKRSKITEELNYKNETVWCIKNRLGTIVTRRNGKVMIMGNCGRGLRVKKGKEYATIIDHVGNIKRHGLPDQHRTWTLDRIVKRRDTANTLRICSNHLCNAPYDKVLEACPYCGTEYIKQYNRAGGTSAREALEQVDGDLMLLDPDTIRELEADLRLESPEEMAERVAMAAGVPAGVRAGRNQRERIEMQKKLAETIAIYAGKMKHFGYTDRQIHKKFFLTYDMSITGALSLKRAEMESVEKEIRYEIGI